MSSPFATTAELSLKSRCMKYFGKKDLYEVLDISKDASEKEIRQAYRKLSLKVHPDRVGKDEKAEATEKFKFLGGLLTILSTKSKRDLYDKRERECTGVLFEDNFIVKLIHFDAKQSDRVSCLGCESEFFKMDLILAVKTLLYPKELQNKFRLVLGLLPRTDSRPSHAQGRDQRSSDAPGPSKSPSTPKKESKMTPKGPKISGPAMNNIGKSNSEHAPASPANSFEHQIVMLGKICRVESENREEPKKLSVYGSFGGLFYLLIQGDSDNLQGFEVGLDISLVMIKESLVDF